MPLSSHGFPTVTSEPGHQNLVHSAPRSRTTAYQLGPYAMDDLPLNSNFGLHHYAPATSTPPKRPYPMNPYDQPSYSQATMYLRDHSRGYMTDPPARGARRVGFAPSPETILNRRKRPALNCDTGMKDVSEQMRPYRNASNITSSPSEEENAPLFKCEASTARRNPHIQNMYRQNIPGYSVGSSPLSLLSASRPTFSQDHDDDSLNELSDTDNSLALTPAFMNDHNPHLFEPQGYNMGEGRPLPTNANFGRHSPMFVSNSPPPGKKHAPWRNIGEGRRESRYAGGVEPTPPRSSNRTPDTPNRKKVPQKNDLKLLQGRKLIKRAYGVNDPENIAIINMKDDQGMGWQEIVDVLNEERVAHGKTKFLSITAVANRYSRNCPVLMASVGKEFVPLSVRKSLGTNSLDAPRIDWTEENDQLLLEAFNEYENSRWETIAEMFSDDTGINVQPEEVARRFAALN